MIKRLFNFFIGRPLMKKTMEYVQKSDANEKYQGTMYYSKRYARTLHVTALITVVLAIVLWIIYGLKDVKEIIGLLGGLVLIIELMLLAISLYKIEVNEKGFVKKKFGISKRIAFIDIKLVKVKIDGSMSVYVQDRRRKVAHIAEYMIGFKEFLEILKQNQVPIADDSWQDE